MIYIDVDGVLLDFIGTAKKFGIELEPNEHGKWKWGAEGFPKAEEFYKVAEPQEWMYKIIDTAEENDSEHAFLTKDYAPAKRAWFYRESGFCDAVIWEAPEGKATFCEHPTDLLIDDSLAECEAWRAKGGIAYWLNLAEQDPFGKFVKWWRMESK